MFGIVIIISFQIVFLLKNTLNNIFISFNKNILSWIKKIDSIKSSWIDWIFNNLIKHNEYNKINKKTKN
jgi:hypothetical protein